MPRVTRQTITPLLPPQQGPATMTAQLSLVPALPAGNRSGQPTRAELAEQVSRALEACQEVVDLGYELLDAVPRTARPRLQVISGGRA